MKNRIVKIIYIMFMLFVLTLSSACKMYVYYGDTPSVDNPDNDNTQDNNDDSSDNQDDSDSNNNDNNQPNQDNNGEENETPVTPPVQPDENKPVITLNGNSVIYIPQGTAEEYVELGATVFDEEDGDITSKLVITGEVDVKVAGMYRLYYNAKDESGNKAITVVRQIIVRDQTAPIVTLNGEQEITISYGDEYIELGAIATDNQDSSIEVEIDDSNFVYKIGTYEIHYIAYDSSYNKGITIRYVTIVDDEASQLSLIGDEIVYVEKGDKFTDQGALSIDNVDGENIIYASKIYSEENKINEINTNIEGTYFLYYQYIDSSNNISTEILRTVIVRKTISVASQFLKGTITKEKTNMESEHFKFEIDANVFVPGYLLEYIEIIYDALEEVSGLKFYNEIYNKGKITIEVEKMLNTEGEVGGAYAYSKGSTIHITSGYLLVGNSEAIAHELSHILQYSQSSWSYSGVLVEGFAQYNGYKVVKYLEEHNIDVAKSLGHSIEVINNVYISGDIYSKTIEYWIANESKTYDISGNGKYSVGMRFMNYLDVVYGSHSRWIKYYESIDPYHTHKYVDQKIDINKQYDALKKTYGNNVFNDFYNWLRNNEQKLYRDPISYDNACYDLTELKKYPILSV